MWVANFRVQRSGLIVILLKQIMLNISQRLVPFYIDLLLNLLDLLNRLLDHLLLPFALFLNPAQQSRLKGRLQIYFPCNKP